MAASFPSGNLMTGQVSVTATATQITPGNLSGLQVTIQNLGTTAVFLGGAGVTATNGFLLPGVVGSSITLPFTGAIYGITASGSQAVAFMALA